MDPMSFITLAASENNPVPHAVNHIWSATKDGWVVWSAHQGNLVLSGLIMIILGPWIARRIATGPESEGNDRYITRNKLAHMIEVMAIYLREQIIRPMLGDRTDRFMPFLWTLFFFILVNNLLGLVPILDAMFILFRGMRESHSSPIGGTATQNIGVTGALAIVSFFVINIAGIRQLGVGGYLHHLTGGAPGFVVPLMVLIELASLFIKPVALALRLFANMTAGHILVATLFMFVGMSLRSGLAVGVPVTLISIVSATAIYFLELFVAFLQAFVFMFLTTVFISMLSHHHEEEHHGAHPAHA